MNPKIEFFQLTDKGPVRENNEDAIGFYQYDDGVLAIVADGLGAHNAGEVASALAVRVLEREMSGSSGTGLSMKNLRNAMRQANLEIYQKAITVPELSRMGAAVIASVLTGNVLFTAHIGDCRLYLLRDGVLTQQSKDHTWVGERVQYGILTPEEARAHPYRHLITRYLGNELLASIDFFKLEVMPGDTVLQCSDGAYEVLLDADLAEALRSDGPEAACTKIVKGARDAGSEDNISVQVLSVRSTGAHTAQPSWWRQLWR